MKCIFYTANFLLIVFYLYPGSIFGHAIYGDSRIQPQLTRDMLAVSTNHIYVFIVISLLGLFTHYKNKISKKILLYLFFLAVFLELMHLIIPQREFEIKDLAGNLVGIIISLIIFLIFIFWRKK